ncbi:unnamed protein product [Cercopithifilaria johnstoni]|uniref:Uncharacterized protein n=1 Tax=Cercopithifilaria johnstoni TaxID=2874296 RepID=A0A8J2Q3W4_9BILA|nr:unnamed protein product [Cercopithifilaria johnstoni]
MNYDHIVRDDDDDDGDDDGNDEDTMEITENEGTCMRFLVKLPPIIITDNAHFKHSNTKLPTLIAERVVNLIMVTPTAPQIYLLNVIYSILVVFYEDPRTIPKYHIMRFSEIAMLTIHGVIAVKKKQKTTREV